MRKLDGTESPRYGLKKEGVGDDVLYKLLDNAADIVVTVAPSLGGQVIGMSFEGIEILQNPDDVAKMTDRLARMGISPSDPDFVRRVSGVCGIPLLFPWPNRIKDATFIFRGKTISLKPNTRQGYAIHGLVRGKAWNVEEAGVSRGGVNVRVGLRARDFPDIIDSFPYPFKITVDWLLRDSVLEFTTNVMNEGDELMPMGFGVHTYFRTPLTSVGNRDDCLITIPAERYWELEEHAIGSGRNIPTGRILSVDEKKFDLRKPTRLGGLLLDDVLTDLRMEEGWTTCTIYDPVADITVLNLSDETFKHVCIFSLGRGPVAIEPYTCTTDAVNLESRGIEANLIALEPGESWVGTIKIIPKRGLAS
jgi:aldose 1-epimerase